MYTPAYLYCHNMLWGNVGVYKTDRLIVLGFNMSSLVGHFVSSSKEREERDRKVVEEIKERGRG